MHNTPQAATDELHVRGLPQVFLITLAAGVLGLAAAAASAHFRSPLALFAFTAATLVGAVGVLDRRVKLSVSDAGVRYAGWGPAVVPWHEFAGYRRLTWRRNPYLQLVARRPSELTASFSWLGRLNQRAAGLARMPTFSIAVTPLAVTEAELVERVGRYLPEDPAPG